MTEEKRNYGIDVLRILSMIMIIILHIMSHGGVLKNAAEMSAQYEAAWLIEIMSYCGVNCYALISGYVGVNSKYKYSNIIELWVKVVFYSLVITAVFSIISPESISYGEWVRACFPVVNGQYWYFTVYFALFFFIPILNIALNSMSKKHMGVVLSALVVLFSIVPTVFHRDVFYMVNGLNPLWLIILYLLGGYIGKWGLMENVRKRVLLIGYLAMCGITFGGKYIVENITIRLMGDIHGGDFLIGNTSPTILAASVFLLLLFAKVRVDLAKECICFFASATFGVYLIHDNDLVRKNLMSGRLGYIAELPWPIEILSILFTAVGIWLVCSMIDVVRERLFKKLGIKKKLISIDNKYLSIQ